MAYEKPLLHYSFRKCPRLQKGIPSISNDFAVCGKNPEGNLSAWILVIIALVVVFMYFIKMVDIIFYLTDDCMLSVQSGPLMMYYTTPLKKDSGADMYFDLTLQTLEPTVCWFMRKKILSKSVFLILACYSV